MSILRTPARDCELQPFLAIWEMTRACDLLCRHCRASAQSGRHPLELTTIEACGLMAQVRGFGSPPPLFVFSGGDPFKREDLFELVQEAARLGLAPAVSPSATPLLTQENLAGLKASGAKAVSLSLDASTPELHDGFRGVPGSFALTLRGARMAREAGLKLQINSTVTRHNLLDLGALARLVASLEVMTWSVFFLVPTGRALREDQIDPSEAEAVMHFLRDASRHIPVKTTEGHHYKRVLAQGLSSDDPLYLTLRKSLEGLPERAAGRRKPMHINSGDGFVFISHTGEVFPSGFLPLSAGNVRQRSLVDIYRGSPLMRQLRETGKLGGKCGRCEFKQLCGGSRSRALATYGDPLAQDPLCAYEPAPG